MLCIFCMHVAFSLVCPPNSIVTSLLGSTGWGIDSFAIGCSDGSVSATVGSQRDLYRKVTCPTGLNNIQVFQGGSCGLGRIQTWCKGALITGKSDDPFGRNLGCWAGSPVQTGYKCTPPSKIIGIEGRHTEYVTAMDKFICS
jgi:hypothetical protein